MIQTTISAINSRRWDKKFSTHPERSAKTEWIATNGQVTSTGSQYSSWGEEHSHLLFATFADHHRKSLTRVLGQIETIAAGKVISSLPDFRSLDIIKGTPVAWFMAWLLGTLFLVAIETRWWICFHSCSLHVFSVNLWKQDGMLWKLDRK